MSNVPNIYTIHVLKNLMCVQGHITLKAGGEQYEATIASAGAPARTSIYFHSWTNCFISLYLSAILNSHVEFQIDWAIYRGEKSLYVVVIQIFPGFKVEMI